VRLSVVIPAYNEQARLPGTLALYLPSLPADAEVLVVDDGSVDATSAMARAVAAADGRVRLIRLPTNRGKGYAVRTGVLSAAGDRVLFADADAATPIGELARLSAAMDAGADVAIGSRERLPANLRVRTTPWRRFAGRTFHQIVRYAGVRGIVDTQCGFKLFRSAVARDLFGRMRTDGFAFDVELLLLAQASGYRIAEVPVNWTHQPGSKVRVVRDGLKMAADVVRLRMRLAASHTVARVADNVRPSRSP